MTFISSNLVDGITSTVGEGLKNIKHKTEQLLDNKKEKELTVNEKDAFSYAIDEAITNYNYQKIKHSFKRKSRVLHKNVVLLFELKLFEQTLRFNDVLRWLVKQKESHNIIPISAEKKVELIPFINKKIENDEHKILQGYFNLISRSIVKVAIIRSKKIDSELDKKPNLYIPRKEISNILRQGKICQSKIS